MLTSLHIENIALIDHLHLQLQPGLNVLTGETGAGKSIILDAIDALLGGKASQRLIRSGAKKAFLEATFTLSPDLKRWLQTHHPQIPLSHELVCSRDLTAGRGTVRSRSRLNGTLVNKAQIEALRPLLVEITAQGQTLQVGSPDRQRDWLDGFGGESLTRQRQQVTQLYNAALEAQRALERRRQAEQQRLEQLDLFDYQSRELTAANLDDPDELDQLQQERQRLSHSVELQQQSYQAYQILYENETGGEACADLLGKAESLLSDMFNFDPTIAPTLDLVSNALASVEEAGRQINAYGDTIESDPQRLQTVEERLSQLKQLIRKYDRSLAELIQYRDELQATLTAMEGDGQSLEALEQAYHTRRQHLLAACAELTHQRQQAAQSLEDTLVAELKPLAMERVQFQVDLRPMEPTATGADRVRFLFSPNPGEPLQPLAETASGGEMSRFLLALKTCFSRVDPVATLIFDEIDVGVSGRVAQAIAEKLHQIARQHQVLCVTHQPIVAAMADIHFQVDKQVVDASAQTGRAPGQGDPDDSVRTVVRVTPLDRSQQRQELAQLAGGQSHQQSLTFADALLAQADTIRQKK
ncbi:DNA repair protein RecN [Halomicronema hongdechloris C2206]|uniref:DNA repair protein RecN n=1 Tax=Halomicronema hongdechloris C2206 TaxID=1641165 RepID=A0A1Z3HN33_9CYAN|nr:DNA repair protein RecN [Halomicronema hongdechloris]ASC71700.1 DNA repair protein RecN [Halomicronema hongdechloris C2206]